jgi:hypothetical protein
MSLRDNTPYCKEMLKLLCAVGFGATVMGTWTLSRPDPETAYLATDGMMWIVVPTAFIAGGLWLLLDIDDWSDIDVGERL